MKETNDTEKPFEGILGTSSEVELLEYLMSCPDFSFNISELARISEVPSRRTCGEIVKRFLKWEILTKVGQVANIKQYRLNTDSELVQAMYRFNDVLISTIMEKELGIASEDHVPSVDVYVPEHVVPIDVLPTEFTTLTSELLVEERKVIHIGKRSREERLMEVLHD